MDVSGSRYGSFQSFWVTTWQHRSHRSSTSALFVDGQASRSVESLLGSSLASSHHGRPASSSSQEEGSQAWRREGLSTFSEDRYGRRDYATCSRGGDYQGSGLTLLHHRVHWAGFFDHAQQLDLCTHWRFGWNSRSTRGGWLWSRDACCRLWPLSGRAYRWDGGSVWKVQRTEDWRGGRVCCKGGLWKVWGGDRPCWVQGVDQDEHPWPPNFQVT